jgi:hypothetical protein
MFKNFYSGVNTFILNFLQAHSGCLKVRMSAFHMLIDQICDRKSEKEGFAMRFVDFGLRLTAYKFYKF